MKTDTIEFFALDHGLQNIPQAKLPTPSYLRSGGNDSAIHGRLGARVALLQSPILPTAVAVYSRVKNLKEF